MKTRILCIVLLVLTFASCSEYNKILKSRDSELKYEYAKKYFAEKKYSRTTTLLEEILLPFTGLSKEEEILFLLSQAYFYNKEYDIASQYYTRYYNKFPKGEYTELARYNSAYGMYLDSPMPQLDQTSTVRALEGFQNFLEYHPQSDKASDAKEALFELQEKLAYKQLLASRLYFNLGLYLGNNYDACVVTAREALKMYPFSQYADELQFLIVRSRHELAQKSVEERKPIRYRELVDEYYNYTNMFPEGKYSKDVVKLYKSATKYLDLEEITE